MVIRRGEIWWAELPESVVDGSGYRRPLVIIQSNEFNKSRINTIIAAVITADIHLSAAPGNIFLSVRKSKLPKEGVINISQIITIDKSFLVEKVHTISNTLMTKVDDGLRLILKL